MPCGWSCTGRRHPRDQITTYAYDLREHTEQNGIVYQDNLIAYDALGRMRWVGDTRLTLEVGYDRMGNRNRITTHVDDSDAPDLYSTLYYLYDGMNR